MSSGNSGAVFFLGTRAHYQVLDQPESRFDSENGNTPSERMHEGGGTRGLRPAQLAGGAPSDRTVAYECAAQQQGAGAGGERRGRRRPSEAALCGDEPRPAPDSEPVKGRPARSLLGFVRALARRGARARRGLPPDQVHYLRHLEGALAACTYRESCRCIDCQSRYFECEDSDDCSSDESEYIPRYSTKREPVPQHGCEDSDDEVFINSMPGDNTSTDLLIEGKERMSVSSDALDELEEEARLEVEVAAGTPVLLNYLLTHPITCALQ